jgi:hypothetical protein
VNSQVLVASIASISSPIAAFQIVTFSALLNEVSSSIEVKLSAALSTQRANLGASAFLITLSRVRTRNGVSSWSASRSSSSGPYLLLLEQHLQHVVSMPVTPMVMVSKEWCHGMSPWCTLQ